MVHNSQSFLLDVFALDIQRARDHGLATYGIQRDDFELEDLGNDFSSFGRKGEKLRRIYRSTWRMDAIVGVMAEPPVGNSILGEVGTNLM